MLQFSRRLASVSSFRLSNRTPKIAFFSETQCTFHFIPLTNFEQSQTSNSHIKLESSMQGSQQQEVKFQDQIFRKLCRFHEAQDTENAHFSVLINVNH